MSLPIVIESYTGGSDGGELVDYYFDLVPGSETQYNFFNSDGTQITTDPSPFANGEKFEFDLPVGSKTYKWKIKDYDLTANPPSGDWENNHKEARIADDEDGEKGTFTAQSGLEEDAKTAKAY